VPPGTSAVAPPGPAPAPGAGAPGAGAPVEGAAGAVVVALVDVEVEVEVDVDVSVPLSLPPQAAVSELSAIAAAIAAVTVKRREIRLSVMVSTHILCAGRLGWPSSAFYPLSPDVKRNHVTGPDSQGVMRR